MVQALGDKAALQEKTSRVLKGTIFAPSLSRAPGTIEVYTKAPNKQLPEIRAPLIGLSRAALGLLTRLSCRLAPSLFQLSQNAASAEAPD